MFSVIGTQLHITEIASPSLSDLLVLLGHFLTSLVEATYDYSLMLSHFCLNFICWEFSIKRPHFCVVSIKIGDTHLILLLLVQYANFAVDCRMEMEMEIYVICMFQLDPTAGGMMSACLESLEHNLAQLDEEVSLSAVKIGVRPGYGIVFN